MGDFVYDFPSTNENLWVQLIQGSSTFLQGPAKPTIWDTRWRRDTVSVYIKTIYT